MTTDAESDAAIRFRDVTRLFSTRERATVALRNLSFEIARGDYVCVLGRSGSGKSTAINLLLGLGSASGGSVGVRGRVACLFHRDRLLPWRDAIDNRRLPMEIAGSNARDGDQAAWLRGIALQGFEYTVKGGARPTVLAHPCSGDPDILLADETFAHLEQSSARALCGEFSRSAKERGKTVLHVTHSVDEALETADRILVLGKPGHLVGDYDAVRTLTPKERAEMRDSILAHLRGAERIALDAPGEAGVPAHLWEAST